MAYRELVEGIASASGEYGWPGGVSKRYKRLDAFERLLDGKIYEHLTYAFDYETSNQNGVKDYVPLLKRRPSVKYGLAKTFVDQHAAMTFGEAHFPHVRCTQPMNDDQTDEQKKTEAACAELSRVMNLPAVMQSALRKGSVGSAAIIAKILKDKMPHVDVIAGKNGKPKLDSSDYTKLDGLDNIWSIDGEALVDFGYKIPKENINKLHWLRRVIDERQIVSYKPLTEEEYRTLGEDRPDGTKIEWKIDNARPHGFTDTYAPTIWLRNLMVGDDAIDGLCTFEQSADICVAVDYLLSQGYRGLRFSMDPLLVIKSGEMGLASLDLAPKDNAGNLVKTSGVLPLYGPESDAKLLEISGKGFEQSCEFVKQLREYAADSTGGIKADNDTAAGNQSGRAIELHYLIVIFMIERLRVSYGDHGLLPLLRLLLVALKAGQIDLHDGVDWSGIDTDTPLSLQWPAWKKPQGADLFSEVQAMVLAAGGSVKAPIPLIHPNLASAWLATELDLDDASSVAADAEKYRDEQEKKQQAQADQQHQQAMEMVQTKSESAGPPAKAA